MTSTDFGWIEIERQAALVAAEMLQVESKIENLISSQKLEFSVYEENGSGVIIIEYCNFGGCNANEIVCDSYQLALREAAIMTLKGQTWGTVSACPECRAEIRAMQE